MGIKKTKTMSFIFGTFLLRIVLGTILAVVLPVVFLYLFIGFGHILPANYSDVVAKAEAEAIENTQDLYVYLDGMPSFIHYLVYDLDYNVLQTNMSLIQKKQGLSYVQKSTEQVTMMGNSRYLIAKRESVSVLLQYNLEAHYVNKHLEALLPSPDVMMIVMMLLFAMINCVIQVRTLAKKFRRELQPLVQITGEITKQNLDCEITGSEVKEIEEILKSFWDMKEALKDSLQKQWEIQRAQKEQVAALTHDLKTPMTVTLGNLDLLCETTLDEEQRQLIGDAQDGIEQMSEYVSLLMEMTMASTGYQYRFAPIQMGDFLHMLCRKTEVLCQNKQINFYVEGSLEMVEYKGDHTLLERAFMNIIRNAVEHTPNNGELHLTMENEDDEIGISVADSGCGFSEKMLKQGTRLFSMEDESRNGEVHYGMGLYFVDSVIKKHGGKLILANDQRIGGARVTIKLPK